MTIDLWKEMVPNILQGKEPLEFEDINREYNPWMVNSALARYIDTILFAAEMNKYYNLDKKMQYDFLFYSIKKKKRGYIPWIKKEKDSEDLSIIKEYYNVSNSKARDIINILKSDQLEMIREKMDIGGK
jgi:hypothetical protein